MKQFFKGQRILVVAAHPDDEVLGCGGTLAKAAEQGAEVFVKFLGEGVSARFPIGDYDSDEYHSESNKRTESAVCALRALNVERYEFGDRLCGQFDTLPMLSIVKEIEATIRKFEPHTLLTHNPFEVNLDHRFTYQAVEVACRPTGGFMVSEIYSFEIPCSGSWTFNSSFIPNVFVDVTDYWDLKLKAWSCYESESRPYPFPRSIEGLTALGQYRGMKAGLKMAEAFRCERLTVI
jgi:LmbE family N-acetylglucosaminyl deacetylase